MFNASRPVLAGLTLLRIYAGWFWFSKGIWEKLLNPKWGGPDGHCAFIVHQMVAKAPPLYHAFLQSLVVPNISAFALMVGWGETLVGVSLLLGMYTRSGAIGGMFLALNYFLGKGGFDARNALIGPDAQAFALTALHAIVPSGMYFGVDAWFRTARDAARIRGRARR